MKKSLIALAVLAASGASFAQSTATVYGIADLWIGSNDTGATSTTTIGSGGVNGSRWGLKGSEDLGGGLKANFKLEQFFDLDTGKTANAGFDSYAYVGFSGGFGEVKLGLVGTAYDDLSNGAMAVFNSALSAHKKTWKSTGYSYPGNGILYVSPDMGGLTAEVSYNLGENVIGNTSSIAVAYEGGPVYAAFAYQTEKATPSATAKNFTQLNGAYDLGVAKLQAALGKVSQNGAATTNEYQLGVTAPVSTVLTVSANYASSKDGAFGGAAEVKRSGYGLGAAYTLSKRTFLYGGYRTETQEQSGAADVDTSLFAVGVQHRF